MEKSKPKRTIGNAANPGTGIFPGVKHRRNDNHDIPALTEEDTMHIPPDILNLFPVGAECSDFRIPRLLPAHPGYAGPNAPLGQDPRPGLDGKYGSTFRVAITIWGWGLKRHPECKFFFETVVFGGMPDDWAEMCDALGHPIIVWDEAISFTKRNRAYWTDIGVSDECRDRLCPMDADICTTLDALFRPIPRMEKTVYAIWCILEG